MVYLYPMKTMTLVIINNGPDVNGNVCLFMDPMYSINSLITKVIEVYIPQSVTLDINIPLTTETISVTAT